MKKTILVFICLLVLLCAVPLLCAAAGLSVTSQEVQLTNILLIGRDNRQEEPARSDCMILCSFSPDTGDVIFTSFLRDLYVPIPGHRDNRLNAAYALGGSPLLQETLEHNLEITVDGCIEVDFTSFPTIIDALGGISITLRQDEAETINREIPGSLREGEQLLNGEQALIYSRIRNLDPDGDFSRSLRQRKLLTALLERYRNADLLTILSALSDTLPLISTSFSHRDILRLGIRLFPLLEAPKITSQRFPADGTYDYETIRGMNVLTTDLEKLRIRFQQSLLDVTKTIE